MTIDQALRERREALVCERVYFDAATILSQLGLIKRKRQLEAI